MSLRSVWVVSLQKDDFGEILYYRTFPTVEKRCRNLHGDEYISLPSPHLFVSNLMIRLGLSISSKQFVEWRDKASVPMQLPVVDVKMGDHEIWPIVSMIKQSLVVCCLPFAEVNRLEKKNNLLQIPSVSVGFSVLLGILNFLWTKSNEEKSSRFMELDNFLTLTMPFGAPTDVEPSVTMFTHSPHTVNFLKKQPAWKPVDYKGKQQIKLKISEFVRCIQSDQTRSLCQCEVFGQISVKADLEGTLNDVTISVNSSDTSRSLSLDSILMHPCIQIHGAATSATVANILRRLRFSPPSHDFVLLQYCSPESKDPPIHGVFKMLGESSVELLIQLKLSEKIKNSFEYCDVIVVFFNRGPVKNLEFQTNHGVPNLSDDKHSLKWNIGTKFPKDLEVAVTAKLDFHAKPVLPHSDPFCRDKNCYVQIHFKLNNTTLSGCNIDPKSVIVSQTSNPKITIEYSVESLEYRLWNNYGDLPFPVNIASKFEKLF